MDHWIGFVIFFTVFTAVHALVNLYIYRHTRPALLSHPWGRGLKWAFWILVVAYPVGSVLSHLLPLVPSGPLVKVGSMWLAAMLYLTLLFVVFDLVRLASRVSRRSIPQLTQTFRRRVIGIAYLVTLAILTAGYFNALYPRVKRITVDVDKPIVGYQELRIGLASDIHLGAIIGNARLSRMVSMMQAERPDIILLAGDIIDEDLGPVIRRDMGRRLKELDAPLGVWGVMGNHEYIGGGEPIAQYLAQHGVKLIRDSVAQPLGLFNLIGREDLQKVIHTGVRRMPLAELMAGVDTGKVTILMDHQPMHIAEALGQGIDLQVSGHTHHGQLWPINLITNAMFKMSRGHRQLGDTHVYVSTGFGTWGPPVRVGNRPEIAIITLRLRER